MKRRHLERPASRDDRGASRDAPCLKSPPRASREARLPRCPQDGRLSGCSSGLSRGLWPLNMPLKRRGYREASEPLERLGLSRCLKTLLRGEALERLRTLSRGGALEMPQDPLRRPGLSRCLKTLSGAGALETPSRCRKKFRIRS